MPTSSVDDGVYTDPPLPPPPQALIDRTATPDFPEVPVSLLSPDEPPTLDTTPTPVDAHGASEDRPDPRDAPEVPPTFQDGAISDDSVTDGEVARIERLKGESIYDDLRKIPLALRPPRTFEDPGHDTGFADKAMTAAAGFGLDFNGNAREDPLPLKRRQSEFCGLRRRNTLNEHIYCELPPRRQLRPIPKVNRVDFKIGYICILCQGCAGVS